MIIQTIQRKSTTENAGYTDRAIPRKTTESHITIVGIPKHQSVIVQNHDESQYPGV